MPRFKFRDVPPCRVRTTDATNDAQPPVAVFDSSYKVEETRAGVVVRNAAGEQVGVFKGSQYAVGISTDGRQSIYRRYIRSSHVADSERPLESQLRSLNEANQNYYRPRTESEAKR